MCDQGVVEDLLKLVRAELARQMAVARLDCKQLFKATGILASAGDGTWGQPKNARFCTTALAGVENRCLIAAVHLTHDPHLEASNGFVIKVNCSSKGMEAIGLDTCAQVLREDGLQVTHWVVDGDVSLVSILTSVHPGSVVCPCVNHYFKNVGKHLRKVVATKVVGCHCAGKAHVRTATESKPLCGCPTLTNSTKIVSACHAAKTFAGDDPNKFRARLEEVEEHLKGNHEKCSFHSKERCTGQHCTVQHKGWECSCGGCTEGKQLCWGRAAELPPECASRVPWTSRTHSEITCPGHQAAFIKKIKEVRCCHESE